MSNKEQYSLMIWCGALWDIAEKSKEFFTQKQVEDVREQMEKLAMGANDHPYLCNRRFYKTIKKFEKA